MASKKGNNKKTSIKRVEKNEEIKIEEIQEEKEEVVFKKIEDTKKQNPRLKYAMLFAQFFLSIITLAFAITFMFNKNIVAPFQISLALTMFVMGINNLLVYKRKFFTIIYFIIGLALIVLAVLTILGV